MSSELNFPKPPNRFSEKVLKFENWIFSSSNNALICASIQLPFNAENPQTSFFMIFVIPKTILTIFFETSFISSNFADWPVICPETKTASGIIIPDTAKEKPQKGNIVSVGPGTKENPVTLKQGMTVLYGKYSGTELKLDGKDYLIMRESDILAIV